MKSEDSFVLKDYFKAVIRGWKRIVIFMIIGGLCGMLISTFRSPLFETRAAIAVTIDYTRTGALSDIQEDQAMRGLGSVIDSDAVKELVVLRAHQAGYEIDRNSIAEMFTLEREDFRWFLRVRDSDPQRAADLANLWAQIAVETLDDGMEHAIIAAHLQQYLDSLEFCMQRQVDDGITENACEQYDFSYILEEVQSTAGEIRAQQQMSYGLMPALEFFLAENAPLNTAAVQGTRGVFVIAGAFLGLIMAALTPGRENL
ncbi:MAG: hypothetical protein XD73_0102 [Anaerolinea thermophila]|uniref:Polysaccharide chain length determinant N-terminal domain-containing protein n=1 Tax=Anaerolinea thermophila TaxID=167964 RepID=A0A124FN76_9CHLR|nr:MAG: hypothetical protein XD73_0102 [Anaerolinea thermophila]